MEAYSQDLRKRVVQAMQDGLTSIEAAAIYSVGEATARRWSQQLREEGSLALKSRPGRTPKLSPKVLQELEQLARATPDATREDFQGKLTTFLSVASIGRGLRKLGFTRKKRLWSRRSPKPSESSSRARRSSRTS